VKLRAKESFKTPNVDIALPMHLKKLKTQSLSIEDSSADNQKQNTFNFVFMVKKGNKPQFHNMEMPLSSEFAEQFKAREQVCRYVDLICSKSLRSVKFLNEKKG
jgi:regulator of nonsense transcripts 2